MTLKADQFERRALTARPEQLVEGWPADYWLGWEHPTRQAQLRAAMVKPAKFLKTWLEGHAPEMPGFIFYGPAGFGKTATALMLMLGAARRGYLCRFITAERLASERESTTFNQREGKTSLSLLDEMMAPEILLLDDMATREYSGNVRAVLLDLVRERKSRRRLTFLTTNSKLKTPEGRAVFSRLLDGRVLSTYADYGMDAEDWAAEGVAPDTLRGR